MRGKAEAMRETLAARAEQLRTAALEIALATGISIKEAARACEQMREMGRAIREEDLSERELRALAEELRRAATLEAAPAPPCAPLPRRMGAGVRMGGIRLLLLLWRWGGRGRSLARLLWAGRITIRSR